MFKIVLIILLVFINSVCAEIVKELKVVGNKRISTETIKVYGEIDFEKDYSAFDLNKIIKNLYSTNFFEEVNLKLENNTLKISVIEYPLLNNIEIVGEKSETIKKLILEKLKSKSNGSYIESNLIDDISLIRNLYSSLGFNFSTVNSKIEKFTENRVNLIFEVEKGKKTYIRNISFIGDKKIRDSRLRNIIASEENKFWKILSKNTFYNVANIELDKRLLINYYKSLGFYDVQVLSSSAEIDNRNFLDITYNIIAGDRYKISKISTSIDDVIDKKMFLPLEKTYNKLIGKYYSPFNIKKVLDDVDLIIANNDLQFVEHSISEIIEKEKIEIKINIFEGPKTLVEKINILGNTVTNEAVIRSELLIDEGDPFNLLKFEKSIAKLKSRNIFGQIQTKVNDGTQSNQKILNILVEEKPTGEISAGAGIGTNGGNFVFSVTENNWMGKGINVSTNFDLSSETFTGELSVEDPNFNFTGNSLSYFVSNTKNDKPNSGFKNNLFTAGIGTRFEQYKDIYLAPRLSFSYDKLKVNSSASEALQKQRGTFSDLTLDYSITNDQRDRAFGPTSGHVLNFNQSFPMYADSPFIKNSISYSVYNSFNPDLIGAFKFSLSAINGLNNKDVRLSKRLFLNTSKLRGFEYGKIGPKDGSDFVGGNYVSSANFEMNLPNLLPDSTNIDLGLFLDFGNVWHVDYSNDIDDSNKIRSTVGVNTNWLSPIGPMSFILSQNISKASTDVTESFNFRLGTSF